MNIAAFQASVKAEAPPKQVGPALKALWHAAKGDWETAHNLVQSDKTEAAAWVHAYLHRVEGDLENARYWYDNAGRPEATESLQKEWCQIAEALL